LYQPIVQALIRGFDKTQSLKVADNLIAVAEYAMDMRQPDVVEQAGQILMNSPLPREYQSIGQYYRALSTRRLVGSTAAKVMLESVVESPITPLSYKARALQAIGAIHHDNGDTIEGLRFFLEAGYTASHRHGRDLLTATLSSWMIAVTKSIKGDNKGALEDLRKLSSQVRVLATDQPFIYYSYANSLAVELGETGNLEEAQYHSSVALASPYAIAHPEWRGTKLELAERDRYISRSVVTINRKDTQSEIHTDEEILNEHLIQLTEEQESIPSNRLLLFRKRAFKPKGEPLYSHLQATEKQLTFAQKRSRIIDIANNLTEDSLDRLLAFASELDDRPLQPHRPREIDLEEKGMQEMLMSLWTSGDLNLEDHVAVLSALRDCDNNLRMKNIINSMISYIFRFTQERMDGEHFWRKRVEARLTPETG
jgi:hypothetical protein